MVAQRRAICSIASARQSVSVGVGDSGMGCSSVKVSQYVSLDAPPILVRSPLKTY